MSVAFSVPATPYNSPKTGRPSLATAELKARICTLISQGATLRALSLRKGFPQPRTVARWVQEDPEFALEYAKARALQAEVMDDRILTVADECTPENAPAARVKIDAYKWRAGHLNPTRYRDTRVQHTGAGGGPIQVEHTHVTLDLLSLAPEQRDTLRDLLLAARASAARDVTPRGEGE